METITLAYNAQNVQAKNLLNYILASGLLVPKIEKDTKKITRTTRKTIDSQYSFSTKNFKFNRETANDYD